MSGVLTGLCLYMPLAGFEPGTYGILFTWIGDSALNHSATTAGLYFEVWPAAFPKKLFPTKLECEIVKFCFNLGHSAFYVSEAQP